jgi:hypothetical protein
MQRRSFLGMLGAMGSAGLAAGGPAESGRRTRIFALDSFKLRQGTQPARLNDFFRDTMLPALARIHSGPKIVLEAVVASHVPQVLAIYGFVSIDEMWGVHGKVMSDAELGKKFQAWENGPEPAFESLDTSLLEAAEYSPEIAATAGDKPPRIFELRVYRSPTFRQHMGVHERFGGPEIKIFHRVGIHPILYASTLIGQNIPNLTYLIPFDDLAAREKAWAAFGADAEWQKVRQESVTKYNQPVSVSQISLFKATAYSPVR